jgi:HSP20 family protein
MVKSKKADSMPTLEDFRNLDNLEMSSEFRYAVNIRETDHKYELQVVAPGFRKGDFNITTDGGLLAISVETDHEDDRDDDNYIRKEFSKSSFIREFSMPASVIVDHISCMYHNGILTIDLKKTDRYLIGKKHIKVD